ncbi:MAG: fibro-slime domain-containing protein [Polyangiaceae bacterium]|nr:fibro-slime domain-containing protein [Polyangiaceae bacterium]
MGTRLEMRASAVIGCAAIIAVVACGSTTNVSGFENGNGGNGGTSGNGGAGGNGANGGSGGGFSTTGAGAGSLAGDVAQSDASTGSVSIGGIDGGSGTIPVVIRDFRFYDATDSTTNPDFQNPPTMGATIGLGAIGGVGGAGGATGGAGRAAAGPWDDTNIVTTTLGSDQKPVYANPTGTTLTTHGQADFNQWYNDTPGTNIHVDYPLPLTQSATGSFGYDSNTDGVPYNIMGQTGNGFFPIDDGTTYATTFGNQSEPHNYSFTMEIHTVFTYAGGETFQFRGDDDVFVYINGQLVINLGGIHNPETASVTVDSLGLTAGQTYPLDFFSAERNMTGSNIEFTTTLQLRPAPTVK